ncbi:MAG: DUF1631 family protein [Pseudomonadota bacterium]
MADPLANIKPENITAALKGFYTPPKPGNAVVEGDALITLLQALPALSVNAHVDPILVQIPKHHPGVSLNAADHALVAFVDDCITQVLRQTDLDYKIESFIRDLAPHVAVIALQEDARAITRRQPIWTLLDTLMTECVGWSEDLGILGDQYMEKVEQIVRDFVTRRSTLEECQQQLDTLFEKERPLFEKMEKRLCDQELGTLIGEKGKYYAAEMLNQYMNGKPLSLFIIFMLQGSWYEFLCDIFVNYGMRSEEWQNVTKLTEALIWSLQPQKNRDKQAAIIKALPGQIREFCSKLSMDTEQAESCIADVEAEHEKILAGEPSEPCDFDLLPVDTTVAEGSTVMERTALKQIERMKEGQWFIYDDKRESEEKVARIKLILNWRDTQRMLFTNHNRRKVLQMSYVEFSGHQAAETIKLLNPRAGAHEIARTHLLIAIQGIQAQKKKEVEVVEVAERKQISQEYLTKRKAALLRALEQHQKLALAKEKRARVLREKAEKKLAAAQAAVKGLNVDAWVKLPVVENTLMACRLVAHIPASDKYIFANRAGIKVAEYSGSQLSNMIVTENSEILDTGAEFQNVLASIVSGLREDRNKSYDELTGDTA